MAQAHRNRVFHDFRAGLCRNLVSSLISDNNFTYLNVHITHMYYIMLCIYTYVSFDYTNNKYTELRKDLKLKLNI